MSLYEIWGVGMIVWKKLENFGTLCPYMKSGEFHCLKTFLLFQGGFSIGSQFQAQMVKYIMAV